MNGSTSAKPRVFRRNLYRHLSALQRATSITNSTPSWHARLSHNTFFDSYATRTNGGVSTSSFSKVQLPGVYEGKSTLSNSGSISRPGVPRSRLYFLQVSVVCGNLLYVPFSITKTAGCKAKADDTMTRLRGTLKSFTRRAAYELTKSQKFRAYMLHSRKNNIR
jgi:hypothetical protein